VLDPSASGVEAILAADGVSVTLEAARFEGAWTVTAARAHWAVGDPHARSDCVTVFHGSTPLKKINKAKCCHDDYADESDHRGDFEGSGEERHLCFSMATRMRMSSSMMQASGEDNADGRDQGDDEHGEGIAVDVMLAHLLRPSPRFP
jgi:hypothetical protein